MLCSPFTPYLSVTLAFNVPLVLWGWKTIENKAAFCEKAWWLWLNAVMAMIHIIGSCYIVYRIQEDKEPIEEDAFLYHNEVKDDVNGYPPHQQQNSNAPAQTVQIIGLAPDDDDVSALGVGGATTTNPVQTKNKDGNTSDDSNDSKEPLRVVVEVPANNPHRSVGLSPRGGGSRAVGSPRSLSSPRSVSSKNSSPFRTIFSNTRNTIDDAQRRAPDTIESVASLVAGLPDDTKNDRANSLPRIGKVLCYDPGTAVYFFVAILWVTWQTVGVGFAVSLARNNHAYVYQCADIKEWVVLSTICGFLYMMLGLFAFGCSLLCLR